MITDLQPRMNIPAPSVRMIERKVAACKLMQMLLIWLFWMKLPELVQKCGGG